MCVCGVCVLDNMIIRHASNTDMTIYGHVHY